MGDPEFRSDESVILRTNGIFVKSIPFEGILTNKRIILVDRAKNLLPQKEIPLVTIKDIEVGENAIRDQIITLSVLSKTGETRQMILTFSRQTGGNRIRERNAWAKALKENTSSSFEQVIRKVVPGRGVALKKAERTVQPRVEVSSTVSPSAPSVIKASPKKETERHPPVKIVETPSKVTTRSDVPVSGFGTYCSRCGNRVPEGSGFCNRCGSPIFLPASMQAGGTSEKVLPSTQEPPAKPVPPITPQSMPTGLPADRSAVGVYPDSIQEASRQQETAHQEQAPFSPDSMTGDQEPDTTSIPMDEEPGSKASDITASQVSESISLDREIPPPRNPRSRIKPGRRTVYAGVVIVLIIAVIIAGFFMYPLLSRGGQMPASTSISPTTIPPTQIPSGNIVTLKVTPVVTVPSEGIYVHIKYIGGWKGSYGIPADLKTITNSGDRYYPVENATGIVQASFGKLDGSTKQTLLVEILKNGQVLTSGNTTAGFGTVTLSVDTVTGVAKAPELGTGGVVTTIKTQTNQT